MSEERFQLSEKERQKNQTIITGFLNNDWNVMQACYKDVYEMVLKLVKNNSGDADDARTLMLDSFKVFRKQCERPDFELTGKFSTYIYSVCYKLWLKQLQRRRRDALYYISDVENNSSDDDDDDNSSDRWGALVSAYDTTEETLTITQLYQITLDLIISIGTMCKQVLLLYGDDKSHRDIAQELNISEAASRKRIYDCKESLAKKIQKSIHLNELLSHPNIRQFIEKYLKKK
ncbi:MAG: sigma-70 family RNA polymerase sigma factor [Chitinophagales bacterium]|nr:sigma-70 family RNA polymerase sigma factor [Sphingobacteriales bacterium]MBP7533863.1 sigma-70 family RNA polymerase sigma factor [Chitinophagales bacterium]